MDDPRGAAARRPTTSEPAHRGGSGAARRRAAVDATTWAVAVAPAALLAAVGAAVAALVGAALDDGARQAVWAAVQPQLPLVVVAWLAASAAAGAISARAWRRVAGGPGRIAEQLQALANTDVRRELPPTGPVGERALAAAVNALVRQRDALRHDVARQVADASRDVAQERNRLAALMAELTQSIVVCNLDGRVLLFNARARLQFRALVTALGGAATTAIGGAEPLGLGRSIYAVLDRRLISHALESVQQRLARGAQHPSAQFVTATRGGQLLRVQLAPVRAAAAATADAAPGVVDAAAPLNGFVLMVDNITRDVADDADRERLLHALTEDNRSALGTLQAAVDRLDDAALDAPARARLLGVVRDEIGAMAARLNAAAATGLRALKTRWPLEDMLGADFVAAAAQRIQATLDTRVAATDIDAQLWLRVDSYSLLQALLHLAGRLADEYDIRRLRLRLAAGPDSRAQLDLVWPVQAMSTETVTAWETEPIRAGGETSALTVRDVVDRHGGAVWFERARARQEAFFRFSLPLAAPTAPLEAAALLHHDSRPEFYDFDLFATAGRGGVDAATPLADLVCTVFDTETTGLQPSAGDEIIQIGAIRVVGGKVLRGETFDQLVDPRRPIPAATIPIHGITPQMVAGKPTIDAVLPAFHAWAQDTVLVAHNAAFDLRFLQLKEAASGVRFDQPVLDTLLLSAVVHPQQESHGLEAIAERLGVAVIGRHTALGDAIVTAEVFVKLLPLLAAGGIVTLGQAVDAAQRSYLARVRY